MTTTMPATVPLPPGAYGVACSGGADSVALLLLAHATPGLRLHVIHLNHQTRGTESDADAAFVTDLARRLGGLPHTVATLDEVLPTLGDAPPSNPSARYRAARLALFGAVSRDHRLAGVLLAHHADDQAETVLHRLTRGSGLPGLAGMAAETAVGGVRLLRPLLSVRRADLRAYLAAHGQPWREDASNASDQYFRNRLRALLREHPILVPALLDLGRAARDARDWAEASAPTLPPSFCVEALHALPTLLARVAARRWLVERGVPPHDVEPPVLDRLVRLAADAASPATVNLPGGLTARRARGVVVASTPAPAAHRRQA